MACLVMGVLNVTPDSFYDGGRYFETPAAVAHGHELIDAGADIVDVGGESSRPGSRPVELEEELRRVIPVIEALSADVRVSIDTMKPTVARAALAAGASLVNDVSSSLGAIAAEFDAGLVVMHMRGTPADMQKDPHYDDVVREVGDYLVEKAAAARALGVGEIYIDPGIGFGKTKAHNLALLARVPELVERGWPVLIGTSRKSFLGAISSPSGPPLGPDERFEASLATATFAIAAGAAIVRVHDVRATKHAVRIVTDSYVPPTELALAR
jgi:dihydropteroate synthase